MTALVLTGLLANGALPIKNNSRKRLQSRAIFIIRRENKKTAARKIDGEFHMLKFQMPIVSLAFGALITLSACDNSSGGSGGVGGMTQSQTLGTGAGAAAGGLAGYLFTGGAGGTLIGAAAGAVIGNRLGNYLEGDEQQAAALAAARAAEVPTGQRVTWQKTGTYFQTAGNGWASPTGGEYLDRNGRTCRHIRQSATKDGNTQEDTITLCNGSTGWIPA